MRYALIVALLINYFNSAAQNLEKRYGWNIYYGQDSITAQEYVDSIYSCNPGLFRINLQWRFFEKCPNEYRSWELKMYLDACSNNNTIPIISFRRPADNQSTCPNWVRCNSNINCNYWCDSLDYKRLIDTVQSIVVSYGLEDEVIYEAWNEPDVRWYLGNINCNNQYPDCNPLVNGTGYWSGGGPKDPNPIRRFNLMHEYISAVLGNNDRLADGGWTCENWIAHGLDSNLVGLNGVHTYSLCSTDPAGDIWFNIFNQIRSNFDATSPNIPFYLGEFGDGSQTLISSQCAIDRSRKICDSLENLYPSRFVGATIHLEDVKTGKWWQDENVVSATTESHNEKEIEIFPNPTQNKITIVGKSLQAKDIHLYDVYGNSIPVHILKSDYKKVELDVSHFPTGLFFVMVYGLGAKKIAKL